MNLPTIPNINEEIRIQAAERQIQLTKPTGSMGRLEELSIDIAGMTGVIAPELKKRSVFLMAADHGIAREGVSPYPTEVTPQMVMNFLNHGAAINVLTKQSRSDVVIVDIGVNYDFPDLPGLIRRKVAKGTADMLHKEAMTIDQAEEAIQIGMDVLNQAADNGLQMSATGEMGIGNTTSAAAITAVLCGKQPAEVTGRGTGLDDAGLARKVAIIEQVLKNRKPDVNDPMDILCKIGGLEIAGMAGACLGAAEAGIPIILDGVISCAAALIAVRICPAAGAFLIASHAGKEPSSRVLLEALNLSPVLDARMALGEGTGAVMLFPLLDMVHEVYQSSHTFDALDMEAYRPLGGQA